MNSRLDSIAHMLGEVRDEKFQELAFQSSEYFKIAMREVLNNFPEQTSSSVISGMAAALAEMAVRHAPAVGVTYEQAGEKISATVEFYAAQWVVNVEAEDEND